MDGIEIKVTGATPLEALARLGAFGMHCLANDDVCAAAARIFNDAAAKEKAAQLDAEQKPQTRPTATTQGAPTEAPKSSTPAPIVAPTAPVAPTAAPTYTLDAITRAGADFLARHPDKQSELNALFPQFGITTLTELRPEQMGPFATAMRALGVAI